MEGAGGVSGLLAVARQGSVYYPCMDGNGNVGGLYAASGPQAGKLVARYDYDPFGRRITNTGPEVELCPFGFSTKYTDSETGQAYYGYRYYSSELGRWVSRDPIGERGGINLLSIGSDLINAHDNLGLELTPYKGPAPINYADQQLKGDPLVTGTTSEKWGAMVSIENGAKGTFVLRATGELKIAITIRRGFSQDRDLLGLTIEEHERTREGIYAMFWGLLAEKINHLDGQCVKSRQCAELLASIGNNWSRVLHAAAQQTQQGFSLHSNGEPFFTGNPIMDYYYRAIQSELDLAEEACK